MYSEESAGCNKPAHWNLLLASDATRNMSSVSMRQQPIYVHIDMYILIHACSCHADCVTSLALTQMELLMDPGNCAFVAKVPAASSQFMMPWIHSRRAKTDAEARTHCFMNCGRGLQCALIVLKSTCLEDKLFLHLHVINVVAASGK